MLPRLAAGRQGRPAQPIRSSGGLAVGGPACVNGGMQYAGGERPILFLDVDGVLVVSSSEQRANGTWWPTVGLVTDAAALLARLAVAFDIRWATRWGHAANTDLSPQLGLPMLPVVELDRPDTQWTKLPAVMEAAGSRAMAWIDDDLGHDEWSWANHRHEPTKLVQTEMAEGMSERHCEELLAFAASVQR